MPPVSRASDSVAPALDSPSLVDQLAWLRDLWKQIPKVAARMISAMLDPRAIVGLFAFGGVLMVIGTIVWLRSIGLFDNPETVAAWIGVPTLAALLLGCLAIMRTPYRMAGQAVTLLACVAVPLNMWFWLEQSLLPSDTALWWLALVCLALYGLTLVITREPLILYPLILAATASLFLFVTDVNWLVLSDLDGLCLALLVMSLVLVHLRLSLSFAKWWPESQFLPPVQWMAMIHLLASAVALTTLQHADWLNRFPYVNLETATAFTQTSWALLSVWLVLLYASTAANWRTQPWLIQMGVSGYALLMSVYTGVALVESQEVLLMLLAVAAVGLHLIGRVIDVDRVSLRTSLNIAVVLLSAIPVLWGGQLHLRGSAGWLSGMLPDYEVRWLLVVALVVVAVTNRISAQLTAGRWQPYSQVHFFFSGLSLFVAIAACLRILGAANWAQQAPVLMLVPIGYLVASRLWRGRPAEASTARVAQAMALVTVVISCGFAFWDAAARNFSIRTEVSTDGLWLALALALGAVFYYLASRLWNGRYGYLVTLLGGLTALQLAESLGWAREWWHVAALGGGLLLMGLSRIQSWHASLEKSKDVPRFEQSAVWMNSGVVLVFLALITSLIGAGQPVYLYLPLGVSDEPSKLMTLALTAASLLASALALLLDRHTGRRSAFGFFAFAFVVLTAFRTYLVLDFLTPWQMFQLASLMVGLIILTLGHLGFFREDADQRQSEVSFMLWVGSILATVPLTATMFHHVGSFGYYRWEEVLLLGITMALTAGGIVWKVRATTITGGAQLVLLLLTLLVALARPQLTMGIALLIGGGIMFLSGLLLSIYRDKMKQLPDYIAKRQGLFRIISWR